MAPPQPLTTTLPPVIRPADSSNVQEAIGSVTGSEEWKKSGEEQKNAGIEEMKEAGKARDQDSAQHGLGGVEKLAGQAVGCEGMEKEGEQSKTS